MSLFLTQTTPLTHTLLKKADEKLKKIGEINLSINLKHEELLLVNDRERSVLEEYQTLERIPSGFWRSKVIENLPVNFSYRRRTCNELVDSEYWKIIIIIIIIIHLRAKLKNPFSCRVSQGNLSLQSLHLKGSWFNLI